eukprot:g12329.t1
MQHLFKLAAAAFALNTAPTVVSGFGFGLAPRAPSLSSIDRVVPASTQPHGSQGKGRATAAVCPNDINMIATAPGGTPAGAQAPRGRGAAVKKVVKSAGIALAWYLASSAAAVAVSSAAGGAVTSAPLPRKKYTALPILLIAYALSRKDVKERTRLEGVAPRDPESVKVLADDAKDLAMSWGKPAARMAYTSVDAIVFVIFSRLVGFPFKEIFSVQRLAHFQDPEFWLATILASTIGFAIVSWSRKVGQGYLRSVCASALSPAMQRLVVRPAKAVASVAGMGEGWDLGLTDEQREARRPSIELRKSLSTFKDPDFHGDGGIGDTGGAAFPPPPEQQQQQQQQQPGIDDIVNDGAPPDLKRSS